MIGNLFVYPFFEISLLSRILPKIFRLHCLKMVKKWAINRIILYDMNHFPSSIFTNRAKKKSHDFSSRARPYYIDEAKEQKRKKKKRLHPDVSGQDIRCISGAVLLCLSTPTYTLNTTSKVYTYITSIHILAYIPYKDTILYRGLAWCFKTLMCTLEQNYLPIYLYNMCIDSKSASGDRNRATTPQGAYHFDIQSVFFLSFSLATCIRVSSSFFFLLLLYLYYLKIEVCSLFRYASVFDKSSWTKYTTRIFTIDRRSKCK